MDFSSIAESSPHINASTLLALGMWKTTTTHEKVVLSEVNSRR